MSEGLIGINGIETRTDKAVVIALLVQTVKGCGFGSTVASTDINGTVFTLNHAADHQVLVAHLVPSDTKVVGLVNAAALGADVHDVRILVKQYGCGLTTHIVGAHANPIKVAIGALVFVLHGFEHQSGVNKACVLVSTKATHKLLSRCISLCTRHIVSAIVSNGNLP